MKIPVGVSSCVLGEQVRFDGGHKRNHFAANELVQYFDFMPVCPEMAIGMTTPRPTIRLIDNGNIRLVDSKNSAIDFTESMTSFAQKTAERMENREIRGYLVCKGSPSCGFERVKVYKADTGYSSKNGTGIYTAKLLERMPWLPVEEDGRLNDLLLRENFITRVFALDDLYNSISKPYTRGQFIAFHSRYKLTLMAHNQKAYRELGKLVGNIHEYNLDDFFCEYRLAFMKALSKPASKRDHTNVLKHVQGYFKNQLDKEEKAEFCQLIDDYHSNELPLMAPVTLINHYLKKYPNEYLTQQAYFAPYPQDLKLRKAL